MTCATVGVAHLCVPAWREGTMHRAPPRQRLSVAPAAAPAATTTAPAASSAPALLLGGWLVRQLQGLALLVAVSAPAAATSAPALAPAAAVAPGTAALERIARRALTVRPMLLPVLVRTGTWGRTLKTLQLCKLTRRPAVFCCSSQDVGLHINAPST